MIMSDDNCTMRITKNDLCTHVNQLIDKEQTAFKHFLMNQYASFSLSSYHEHHTQQVGSQSRPGSISYCHNRSVDKGFNLIMILLRYKYIITSLFQFSRKTLRQDR